MGFLPPSESWVNSQITGVLMRQGRKGRSGAIDCRILDGMGSRGLLLSYHPRHLQNLPGSFYFQRRGYFPAGFILLSVTGSILFGVFSGTPFTPPLPSVVKGTDLRPAPRLTSGFLDLTV